MSRGESEPNDDAESLNAAWIIFLLTLIIGSAVYRCFGPDSTTQSTCNSVRFDDENECVETDQLDGTEETDESKSDESDASKNDEGAVVNDTIESDKSNNESEEFVIVEATSSVESRVHGIGPGITAGVAGKQSAFIVIGEGTFDFLIEGPGPADIDFVNFGQGIGLVTYVPTCAGEYRIDIKRNDGDIEQTYISTVTETDEYTDVRVASIDVEPFIHQLSNIDVEVEEINDKTLEVLVAFNDQTILNITSGIKLDNGEVRFEYRPEMLSKYYVFVTVNGILVPDSPFEVNPRQKVNPNDIRLVGPAVMSKTVKQNCSTFFIIDPTKVNIENEELTCAISINDYSIKPEITKNETGTFTVKFIPIYAGLLNIKIMFGETDIPTKSVIVSGNPEIPKRPSKLFGVEDIPRECCVHDEQSFHLFWIEAAGETEVDLIDCTIVDPVNEPLYVDMIRVKDGYEGLFTPTDCGKHELSLMYQNRHILSSPYRINVTPSFDAFKVTSDVSFTFAPVNQFISFNVDCSKAGVADIEVGVYDADDVNCVQSIEQEGAHYKITFMADIEGSATIMVKYGGDMCRGFPRKISVTSQQSQPK